MISPTVIAVLGPTASGKTGIAVALAKHYGCEIVSCDSRQFYHEMSIGTAKPTREEMQDVAHHFIGHLSIEQSYTAGKYEQDALSKLSELHKVNPLAIVCGGSGLYARALFEGIDDIPSDPKIREEWNGRFQRDGLEALHDKLREIDPAYLETVDQQNPQRLIRGIEATLAAGQPYSTLRNNQPASRPFSTIKMGLDPDREVLYERINLRVDEMVAAGLVEEARALYPQRDLKALQTVGYSELFEHFDGDITLDQAVQNIKQNTRRYAKRQMTWFRREKGIQWFDPDGLSSIISYIDEQRGTSAH